MQIGLIHYTSWPTVGGVEVILRQQAGLMAKAGHEVSVICGSGRQFSPNIKTVVLEDLNIASPSVTAAQAEIWNGYPAAGYFALVEKLRKQLTRLLKRMDCIIVHNLMTMPFHLAATQVLIELAESGTKMLAWTHDLAASNQDYSLPRNSTVDMIREKHSSIRYIAVSQTRANEFEELSGHRVDAIIPNGMDQVTVLGLTPEVEGLVNQLDSQATIFLYPTRILPRKNLGFSMQILKALNELGHAAYLLITGAANQYNAGAQAHLSGLKQQATDLAMTDRVIWVNERFQVDEQQLRSLYLAADALLFSTRQEGFGLPLLEAAAFRLPIFCSDIEPLRSNLADNVVKFDLRASPRNIGETISLALKTDLAFSSRKRLLMNHSAQTLYREKIEPLLRSLS
ncbi:MAG: glycosyltransferase family 4 protein [Verrucomicrobia bacterium]|nr:glycosyltransferase family 4 protein [Verrucomicrobiota bacterium]